MKKIVILSTVSLYVGLYSCERRSAAVDVGISESNTLGKRKTQESAATHEFEVDIRKVQRGTNEVVVDAQVRLSELNGKEQWDPTDYDLFYSLLTEISANDPEQACKIISLGLGRPVFDVKVAMFSKMLETFGPERLSPLLEELANSTSKNSEGAQSSEAMVMALAKVKEISQYSGVLNILFRGDHAETFISYYFNEATATQGIKLRDLVGNFNLEGRKKDQAILSIAFSTASSDPEAALSLLDGINADFSGSAYGRLISQWMEKDPVRAKEVFMTFDAPKLQSALRDPDLLDLISQNQNLSILEHVIQKLPLTKTNSAMFEQLVNGLSSIDKTKAIDVLDDLPTSPVRSQLIQKMWQNTSVESLSEANSIVAGLPASSQIDASLGMVNQLARTNQELALQFINGSDVINQSKLIAKLTSVIVLSSPTNAAALFSKEVSNGRLTPADGAQVAGNISLSYANHDLNGAKLWATSLPAAAQPGAFRGLMKSWSRSDPVEASKWLASIPPGSSRDAGARALIDEIQSTDPQTASLWRKTLGE
jgi:hypothetical protein